MPEGDGLYDPKPANFATPVMGGTHGFIPEHENIYTGFISFGGKANGKTVIKEMSLTDIAPLKLLDFS